MSKRPESESKTRKDESTRSKRVEPGEPEFEDFAMESEDDFDPEESIFELDPFVLPGETMTQEITPIGFESPLTDSDISKLESKTSPGTESQDDDQEDTIPPGAAKDEWLERQTGKPKEQKPDHKDADHKTKEGEHAKPHGDQDAVFPIKYIQDAKILKGGTHVMILNKGSVVSKMLQNIIENDGGA